MARRIIFVIIFLGALSIVGFLYINKIFLPIKLKQFIETKAENFLDRPFSVGDIRFKPVQGFVLEDIKIYRKDEEGKLLAEIDKATFNILLPSFFKNKTIIIPSVKLERPFVYLRRNKDKTWNFSDLLPETKSSPPETTPPSSGLKSYFTNFSFYVRKVAIEEGQVDYLDETPEQPFFESLQKINLSAKVSLDQKASFSFETMIPSRSSSLNAKGNFDIKTKSLSSKISIRNIYLAQYLSLFLSPPRWQLDDGVITSAELDVSYEDGQAESQGHFRLDDLNIALVRNRRIKGNVKGYQTTITWKDKQLNATGEVIFPHLQIILTPERMIQGEVTTQLTQLIFAGGDVQAEGNVRTRNAFIQIDAEKNFQGDIRAKDILFSKEGETVKLAGDIFVDKSLFKIEPEKIFQGDVLFSKSQLVFKDQKTVIEGDVTVKDAKVAFKPENILKGNITASGAQLTYLNEDLQINSQLKINKANLQIGEKIKCQANPDITISYNYNATNDIKSQYRGSLQLTEASIKGIPQLDHVDNIRGNFIFKTGQIKTQKAHFNTQNTDFALSGSLKNFEHPLLDIKASSEKIDLGQLLALFPKVASKIKVRVSGQASATAHYKGLLSSVPEAEITVSSQLLNATVTNATLPSAITGISGKVDYQKDLVTWQNVTGNYGEKSYVVNGKAYNFSIPMIETSISSDALNLTTQIKILRQAFQILSLKGNYFNSTLDLKGDVHLFPDSEPDIDVKGLVHVNLEDIVLLLPELKDKIDGVKPKGNLVLEGLFRGKLKNWRNWQLTFDAQSEQISLIDSPVKNILWQFSQRDDHISKCLVSGTLYSGKVQLSASGDLSRNNIPFNARIDVENLNLEELKKDHQLKIVDFRGDLVLSAQLQGSLKQIQQVDGTARCAIKDGFLGEIDVFKGILGALKKIPGFVSAFSIVVPEEQRERAAQSTRNYLTGAQGNFVIQNQKISSQNILVLGSLFDLDITGSMTFDRYLEIVAAPNGRRIAENNNIPRLLGSPIQVKIFGPLNQLKYETIVDPVEPLKNVVGTTIEAGGEAIQIIEGIFGEILK